jgi:hypothetical protein
MRPLGSVEFTVDERDSEVQVRSFRRAGWVERFLAPAAVPPLFVIGWFWQKPELIAAGGGLIMLLLFLWAWGHPSELRVLPDRLITSVYLWKQTETTLSEIQSMQWLRGEIFVENGDPDGLYVLSSGRYKCVLPLISQKQAKVAIDAISQKFPNYPINVPVPGSQWFDVPLDRTAYTLPSQAELDANKKA